ncbi:MAG: heme-binding protein, partial [Pseudomonadota bacterium]
KVLEGLWGMLWWIGGGIVALAVVAILLLTLLQDIETPAYAVEQSDDAFEVRRYPGLVVAEVVREGSRRRAIQNGFRPLASYIFATNRPGARIPMTAPVTQLPGAGTADWRVRFIMPGDRAIDSLPPPASRDVVLHRLPPTRRAAVRFSGVGTDKAFGAHEKALRAWIKERGLQAVGAAEFAYYNDPSTPGFLRRNEVLIDVLAP